MMRRFTPTIAAMIAAGPAFAHMADVPHLHAGDFGAVLVGVALVAVAVGAALLRGRR